MSNKQRRISMVIGVVEWFDMMIAEGKEGQPVVVNPVVLKNAKGNLIAALKADGITGIRGDVKVNSDD